MPARQLLPSQGLLSSLTGTCCLRNAFRALVSAHAPSISRDFSSTAQAQNWLAPKLAKESSKSRKGRPRVHTGGSVRGTTLVWGDYGLRLKDHDRRISSQQLKVADETIKKRLRGMKYRLYHRVAATIGVYTSGNDQRMGKGKGSFDYWAARVPVSRILFEVKGEIHEQVVRDAMRLAGNKLPGTYEFVRKGDPPVMGLTKVGTSPATMEEALRRPRLDTKIPPPSLPDSAGRIDSTTP